MDSKTMSEIAVQLKRIADVLERQEKRELVAGGGIDKLKEARKSIKTKKDELLRSAADSKNSNPGRS